MSTERLKRFKSTAQERLIRLEARWRELSNATPGGVLEMQREAHTLKAEARFMGFRGLVALLDGFESLLESFACDGEMWSEDLGRIGLSAWKVARDSIRLGGDEHGELDAMGAILRGRANALQVRVGMSEWKGSQRAPRRMQTPARFSEGNSADRLSRPVERLLRNSFQLARLGAAVVASRPPIGPQGASTGAVSTTERRPIQQLRHALSRLEQHNEALRHHFQSRQRVSLRTCFGDIDRPARDLARDLGKDVFVERRIAPLGIDGSVASKLYGIVVHLLNNALDHGIETRSARQRVGKSARGLVVLEAFRSGAACVVTISDDGAGIDREALGEHAAQQGAAPPCSADASVAIEDLVFAQGVTSRDVRSSISGRGIGLAAVRRTVEELGGTVEFDSEPGRGTRFTVSVPLPVALETVWRLRINDVWYALPVASVLAIGSGHAGVLKELGHAPDSPRAFDIGAVVDDWDGEGPATTTCSMILDTNSGPVAISGAFRPEECEVWVVERGSQRPQRPGPSDAYSPEVGWMRWLSLATVEGVVRGRLQRAKRVPARAPQVLVVEDSAIVRDMVRELIEQEGIEVLTAVSGEEALEVLSVHPDIALTVTDLQMPGLDALLLVRSISKRMPVVVLSMGDDGSAQQRAVAAGAVDYITKSDFSMAALQPWLEPLKRLSDAPS